MERSPREVSSDSHRGARGRGAGAGRRFALRTAVRVLSWHRRTRRWTRGEPPSG